MQWWRALRPHRGGWQVHRAGGGILRTADVACSELYAHQWHHASFEAEGNWNLEGWNLDFFGEKRPWENDGIHTWEPETFGTKQPLLVTGRIRVVFNPKVI